MVVTLAQRKKLSAAIRKAAYAQMAEANKDQLEKVKAALNGK